MRGGSRAALAAAALAGSIAIASVAGAADRNTDVSVQITKIAPK